MTTEEGAKKKAGKKKPASDAAPKRARDAVPKKKRGDVSDGSTVGESVPRGSGPTGMQALALWELILEGDGKTAKKRSVRLERAEVKGLESTGMITIVPGRQKKKPTHGEKVYLTDAAWEWANHQGLGAHLSRTPVAARILESLLSRVGRFLEVQELALDHLLRPRRPSAEMEDSASASSEGPAPGASRGPADSDMEQRIREAYLRVTKGALNEYVRLALLRAELPGEAVDAVDAELRAMQQRGNAVLYPIDDPQRVRPEDDAAAMRVSGERRDLICIMR